MISSSRSTALSYESGFSLVIGLVGAGRVDVDPAVGEPQTNRVGGAGGLGAGHRLARGVLGERIAALQGALGVVGAKGYDRAPQGVLAALRVGACGASGGALQDERDPALVAAPFLRTALGGGADLTGLLV